MTKVEKNWAGYGAGGAIHLGTAVRWIAQRFDVSKPLDRAHVLRVADKVAELAGLDPAGGAGERRARIEQAPDDHEALRALDALVGAARGRARDLDRGLGQHPDPLVRALAQEPGNRNLGEAWLEFPAAVERAVTS